MALPRHWCRHGHTSHGDVTLTYNSWASMKTRCNSSNRAEFKHYKGKGITYHERWEFFENFLADMGERPSREHSIDRFPDKNGNYEPGNCRWATQKQQVRNTSRNRPVTFRGETRIVIEWSEITGLHRDVITHRLNSGWTVEDVLTKPVKARRKS